MPVNNKEKPPSRLASRRAVERIEYILKNLKEIKMTTELGKVNFLLRTGNWILVDVVIKKRNIEFILGKNN